MSPDDAGAECAELDATVYLLRQAQNGDQEALNRLVARYLPRLQRWATGRLPNWARDLCDTQDLVQETVVRAFRKIEGFEHRGEGSLQAYLRQVLMNRIREESGGSGDDLSRKPSMTRTHRTRRRRLNRR